MNNLELLEPIHSRRGRLCGTSENPCNIPQYDKTDVTKVIAAIHILRNRVHVAKDKKGVTKTPHKQNWELWCKSADSAIAAPNLSKTDLPNLIQLIKLYETMLRLAY